METAKINMYNTLTIGTKIKFRKTTISEEYPHSLNNIGVIRVLTAKLTEREDLIDSGKKESKDSNPFENNAIPKTAE